MKKYLMAIILGTCCASQPVYAEDMPDGMTFDNLLETAKEDQMFQKQSKDRISLLDINSDGIISYNEITNAATGVTEIPESVADDDQKNEMKGFMLEAFEDCDTDLNNRLSDAEIDEFVKKMQYFLLKQRFDSMDKNHDGVYDVQDMPTAEEAQNQLDDAIKKMQASIEKMEKMDTNEMAQNWIKNIGAAVADEDFYQMDQNSDGCLSREEYVNYQMSTEDDSDEDDLKMSASDYGRWYIDIKKAKPDCVTKEEYIADQSLPIEQRLETNEDNPEKEKMYAELLFEEMDTDSNDKLTAEEYAEYNYQRDVNLYAPNEPVMKKETYYNMFMKIKAPEKGWMSKEEFISDYLDENTKIDDVNIEIEEVSSEPKPEEAEKADTEAKEDEPKEVKAAPQKEENQSELLGLLEKKNSSFSTIKTQ